MKLGRNDKCWCKSGAKYKQCHSEFDARIKQFKNQGFEVPSKKIIKNERQIEGIRKAGELNTKALDLVSKHIKIGMSTLEINDMVHEFTLENKAVPAPLGYQGFPKSICTSLNEVVCHGIPCEEDVIKDGDIINVDITTILDGYYADASRMFMMGDVKEENKKLVQITKEALDLGLKAVKPWGFLGDVSAAVYQHAEIKHGYHIVREIGGHGVGIDFHEDPYVCHVGTAGTGMLLVPGMIFTIEPMINVGTEKFFVDEKNGWTIYTKDGSMSAQWEYTILVTETGAEVLTS